MANSISIQIKAGSVAAPGIAATLLTFANGTPVNIPHLVINGGNSNQGVQSGSAAHEVTVTPTSNSSVVLCSTVDRSTSITPANGSATMLQSQADSANGSSYTMQAINGTISQAVTLGVTQSDAGGCMAFEIVGNTTRPTYTATNYFASDTSHLTATAPLTGFGIDQFGRPIVVLLVSAMGHTFSSHQVTMSISDSFGLQWSEYLAAHDIGVNGYAGAWIGVLPQGYMSSLPAQTLAPAVGDGASPYATSLPVVGGFGPVTWSLASGSLPAGLRLSSSGTISGVPTTPGTSTFTATATDMLGGTATTGTQTLNVGNPATTPYISGSWMGQAPQAYSYGTTTIPISNIPGDWLLVLVSWRKSQDLNNANAAIAFVSDSAHNVYRPVSSTGGGSGYFMQAFACPNARAARNVYAATSSYVYDVHVHVLSIRGMSSGYVLDAQVVTSGTSGNSFSLAANATAADFAVAASIGKLSGNGNITVTGAGWSNPHRKIQAQQTASTGPDWHDGCAVEQYIPASGAVNVTFQASAGTFNAYAAILCLFKAAAVPAYSSPTNPAWPNITVQAAFGYSPGNPTSWPTWTDLTGRFLGLNGQRGRNFELDELSAADLTLMLDNSDGLLTPGAPGGYGLDLSTPFQIAADWQGTRYAMFFGQVAAIPQTTEFQRGMVQLTLTDDFTKLPQFLMQSAMITDLLYDRPTHLWPLNDATGASFASNWSGRSTATMSITKSRWGAGHNDGTFPTGFGNSMTLHGTQDTCWGNWTVLLGNPQTRPVGSCLIDRGDSGLPWFNTSANGVTYEMWAVILNNANNLATGATLFAVQDDKGWNAGGMHLKLFALNTGTVNAPVTRLYAGHHTVNNEGMHIINPGKNLFDGLWHHYAVTITPAGYTTLYVDGVAKASWNGFYPNTKPTRIMVGGDTTVNQTSYPGGHSSPKLRQVSSMGGVAGFFDGQMVNVALFDNVLDPDRIASHSTSGATGFQKDLSGTRIQRILAWADWSGPQAIEPGIAKHQILNYLGGSYGNSGLSGAIGQSGTAGGAFGLTQGSQADVTIQDIGLSEAGLLLVGADGTLSFRERNSTFNTLVAAAMGDQDVPVNYPESFPTGLPIPAGITTSNTTAVLSSAWSYAGGNSIQVTVGAAGGTTNVQMPIAALGSLPAVAASVWAMSPVTLKVNAFINWFTSANVYITTTLAATVTLNPNSPQQLTVPLTNVPATAAKARIGIQPNSPSNGQVYYIDRPRISASGFQVPYDGDNAQITTDIQYLFNDVGVTRNIDQAGYRARNKASSDKYYRRVYTRIIYTDPSDAQALVDCASWLLASYQTPHQRVEQVKVSAASNPELFPFVLGTDIGDVVSFTRNPLQGAGVTGNFMVIGISIAWTKDQADFTYSLAPTPVPFATQVIIIDSGTIGRSGNPGNPVLGW